MPALGPDKMAPQDSPTYISSSQLLAMLPEEPSANRLADVLPIG